MKKSTFKNYFCISFFVFFFFAEIVSAQTTQLTLTVSTTPATACTAPCNGTATAGATNGTAPYTYLWNMNPPQQTPTATGLCPGQYQIGIWDSSTPFPKQGTTLVTITCATTGVNLISAEETVAVFPNPAGENIFIKFSNPNGATIKKIYVFNSMGEKIMAEDYSSKGFSGSLSVRNLSSGVYFLELQDEKSSFRTKFVKK